MNTKTVVVALGGNALGSTPSEQLELISETARPICDLVAGGHRVVLTHGNGPQVGMISRGLSAAAEAGAIKSDMPLPECGAMSQGYIGYHLQNAIRNELFKRSLEKPVATIITQVVVDENDPAFLSPVKPVGAFYTKERAEQLEIEQGFVMADDAGRGYRRLVASPRPVDIVEKDSIGALLNSGVVVIAAGGGGIPVVLRDGAILGAAAVVDKDFAAAKLAQLVGADLLVILTSVDCVSINWGREDQRGLARMTVEEAEGFCAEGHFAKGSMLPKVEAAVSFAKTGRTAVIASLKNAAAALSGDSGTTVSG